VSASSSGVTDVEGLRAAVRREARRRKVKVITRARSDSVVEVMTDQESVVARAYEVVRGALIGDEVHARDGAARRGEPEPAPMINHRLLVIELDETRA
jgi:hypothetical protein